MSLLWMQQRRRRSSGIDSYWPGYVDALVNVVLNLMFLVAMLAVGSFVLGLEISRHVIIPEVQTSFEKVRQIVDVALTTGATGPSKTIEVLDTPSPDTSPSTRVDRVRSVDNQTLLQVKFAPDALQMSDSLRTDLTPRLQELMLKNPGATVTVWAVSGADPQSRRISFMRIMALREALNAAGIENSRVVTRILPGTNTTANGQLVYVLVRSTQNRKEPDGQ